jgi:glutamyl-tRNA reductase
MKLFAAGVSHKTAPIEVREQLAVQRNEVVDLAHYLKWFGHLDEIVLLSTCNRVEIYGTTQQTTRDVRSLFQFLTSEELDIGPYTYAHEDVDAVRHLFRVTAGLDSMMLGETEITGQIKRAYETALAAGLTGRVSNRLFQKAFQVAKEIRTHTGIGRGTVSIKALQSS